MTQETSGKQGRDVVGSPGEAEGMDPQPLLIRDVVEEFLDENGIGSGPLEITRVGEGQSNVTYRIRREGADVALRRGPRPPIPRSTHDMLREARVQLALEEQGFPVPHVRAVCEDEGLLGVPFYVMEFAEGTVITSEVPPSLDRPEAKRALGEALVDTLVELHQVDLSAEPVAALGRPDGYLKRQVSRFAELWTMTTRRSVDAVTECADRLAATLPTTQRSAVIHGDYRLGNLMVGDGPEVRIRAVLDWEMSTLGDPLADLGYLVATYAETAEPQTVLELSSVTSQEGFPSRADLVRRYAERSGLDVSALPWYEALALFKAAVFSEAIYTRWLDGEAPEDTTFAESLEDGVPRLAERALEALERM